MALEHQRLFDVKTLGGGANKYTRSGPSAKVKATDLRASKVANEHRNKSRRIDHKRQTAPGA